MGGIFEADEAHSELIQWKDLGFAFFCWTPDRILALGEHWSLLLAMQVLWIIHVLDLLFR